MAATPKEMVRGPNGKLVEGKAPSPAASKTQVRNAKINKIVEATHPTKWAYGGAKRRSGK